MRKVTLNTDRLHVKCAIVASIMGHSLNDTSLNVLAAVILHYRESGLDFSGETGRAIKTMSGVTGSSFRVIVSRLCQSKLLIKAGTSSYRLHPMLVDLDKQDAIVVAFKKEKPD